MGHNICRSTSLLSPVLPNDVYGGLRLDYRHFVHFVLWASRFAVFSWQYLHIQRSSWPLHSSMSKVCNHRSGLAQFAQTVMTPVNSNSVLFAWVPHPSRKLRTFILTTHWLRPTARLNLRKLVQNIGIGGTSVNIDICPTNPSSTECMNSVKCRARHFFPARIGMSCKSFRKSSDPILCVIICSLYLRNTDLLV